MMLVYSLHYYMALNRGPFEETSLEIELFHNKGLWLCLGLSITTQWGNHISNETIRQRLGDLDTINIKVIRQRMQYLGHLA